MSFFVSDCSLAVSFSNRGNVNAVKWIPG